jgi:hypothetical protein
MSERISTEFKIQNPEEGFAIDSFLRIKSPERQRPLPAGHAFVGPA